MAFHLRDALEADIPALAKLHVQTFNETHRGGRPGGPSYEFRDASGVRLSTGRTAVGFAM